MTIAQLENRADRLFGREADLTWLLQRTQRFGLTAITGPSQIGKSWLLMELARRLDRETNPRCLVGFTRSPKGANDPLLQVVSDLYQRWLADARAWEQLRAVWEQQKDGLLPAFARFVGKLSEKAAKLVPIGELGGTAIKDALDGLVTASEDRRSGRLIVSRLEYDQAQELVSSVQKIAGQRIALVMDQWEQTRDLDQQRNTFRDFLWRPEQWLDCHILLGAQEGGEAAELLYDLAREFPEGVCVHALGEMDLADETERRRLISYLHAEPQLRALENIRDDRVLQLVAGYPRVISRWTVEDARETAKTFEGLGQLAQDAHAFRYRDLEKLLLDLDDDRRKLAVRIALLPAVEAADVWQALQSIMLANINHDALDDLRDINVLEREVEAPSFGHPTRRDAARSFLDTRRRETIKAEAKYLILALARSVTPDASAIYFCGALWGLRDTAVQHNLGSLLLALCDAARTLFGERSSSPVSLIEGGQQVRRAREAGLGLILSAGLLALIEPKEEDDLDRRDALLNELRALAREFPDDAAIRDRLARGLVNMLNDNINPDALDDLRDIIERQDALLDVLRALARDFPDDVAVREHLATSLFNKLLFDTLSPLAWRVRHSERYSSEQASRAPGVLAALDELRALARNFPDDVAVRERLARGLVNTLKHTTAKNDFDRRRALLDELRALARHCPDDAVLCEALLAFRNS